MQAREHHFFFAKKMIPTHTFQSTDKMFTELTGPQREAFLFFLWKEAGKGISEPLPHVANFTGPDGIPRLAKLEVVGAVKPDGNEVVVVSMPPAQNANEALFLALVRRPTGVSVFFYERCMGNDHATVSPNEAVLAEVRADGSRLNHGFKPGVDLEDFKKHLGAVLGASLDGLETSLPPITATAFMAGGGGSAATGSGNKPGVGGLLMALAATAALLPVILRTAYSVVPGLLSGLGPVWRIADLVLGPGVAILLLVWIFQVHDARRGKTPLSPAGAVILMLLWITGPLSMRSSWQAAHGDGGLGLAFVWWVFYSFAMVFRAIETSRGELMQMFPRDLQAILIDMYSYTWAVDLLAYGLLYLIVKSVQQKL